MGKRHDRYEEQALAALEKLIAIDRANTDALPGQAMRHIKAARDILKKRRR